MNSSFFEKVCLLLKSPKTFKNWYLLPITYFRLNNKEHIVFKTKNEIKIKTRVNSTDTRELGVVWLQKIYTPAGFEINENEVVIDVGAHIGLFTLFATQFCKKGKIYSFEPIKENFEILLSNLKLNKIENVETINSAVAKTKGTVTIYLNEDDSGHSMYNFNGSPIEVKSISLENFLNENIDQCNYLKMDCEGAEYEIIDSLSENSFKKIQKICLEYHFASSKPILLQNLIQKLKSQSYDVTKRVLGNENGLIYAKR